MRDGDLHISRRTSVMVPGNHADLLSNGKIGKMGLYTGECEAGALLKPGLHVLHHGDARVFFVINGN